jgi:sporulation protein YlmC with PRC-barrel domain
VNILFSELRRTKLDGEDGNVGTIKDLLFDADQWLSHYLVVDSGQWLPGRKVLLSPTVINHDRWDEKVAHVKLTKDQVKSSPPLDEHAPISRQIEKSLAKYYNWPIYWASGLESAGTMAADRGVSATLTEREIEKESENLRSAMEMKGYHIEASDGSIGHIEDFVIDAESWTIRFVEIDTKNWWPGKKVLISCEWVDKIDWADSKMWVDMSKEKIKKAPEYEPGMPITRDYETQLFEYYGRKKYWPVM